MFASLLLMVSTVPAVDNSELVQRAGSTKSVPFAMLPSFAVGKVVSSEVVEPTACNLEQWRHSMEPPRAKTLPTRVVYRESIMHYGLMGIPRYREHRPWQPAFIYFHNEGDGNWKELVLKCELLQTAKLFNGEYVGCVTCVPSIECRAKTLEELEKQLLAEYGKHLDKLTRQPLRYQQWIDSNHQSQWIAALPALNWEYENTWDVLPNRRYVDANGVEFNF